MDYATQRDDRLYQDSRSFLSRSNSMSRPSSKNIYQQRKEYSQTMVSEPTILKQRVEHLLTCKLGSGAIQEPKDALKKLQMMDAQGQVWGQDVVLQVKDQQLQILDIETREEMDSYPLIGIQFLDAILNSCSYDSVLLITLQEPNQSLTNILLFQCWEAGAEMLRNNLQKVIDEQREKQNSRYRFWGPQHNQDKRDAGPPEKYAWKPIEHRFPPSHQPNTLEPQVFDQLPPEPKRFDHFPQEKAPSESPLDLERDTEELNKTLSQIELVVEMSKEAQKTNTKKKIWGKKKTPKGLPSISQYIDCFQKIKHSLNLLGKLNLYLQQPTAPEIIHSLFEALSMMNFTCSTPGLVASVEVPLLTSDAISLLHSCLTPSEMDFWESLGEFWTNNFNGEDQEFTDSAYTPRLSSQSDPSKFSMVNHQHNSFKDRDRISPRNSPLMQVLYEFESRNPKELTVVPGEVLEVLDQSKQWWLVRNEVGEEGYIPNNILEPLQAGQQRNQNKPGSSTQGPMLRPTSRPEEVREWLESENFSAITIKSLGMLTGSQLLHMKYRELQLVCPGEASQILSRLEAVKMVLGMGP